MSTSQRRKFTDDEKQRIVNDAMLRGINIVLQEQRLSYSVFSRWKKKFHCDVVAGKVNNRRMVHRLNELIMENEKLKKIIANLVLELQMARDNPGRA